MYRSFDSSSHTSTFYLKIQPFSIKQWPILQYKAFFYLKPLCICLKILTFTFIIWTQHLKNLSFFLDLLPFYPTTFTFIFQTMTHSLIFCLFSQKLLLLSQNFNSFPHIYNFTSQNFALLPKNLGSLFYGFDFFLKIITFCLKTLTFPLIFWLHISKLSPLI